MNTPGLVHGSSFSLRNLAVVHFCVMCFTEYLMKFAANLPDCASQFGIIGAHLI